MIILSFYLLITIIAVCNVNYSSAQQQIKCDFKFDIDHNSNNYISNTYVIDITNDCAMDKNLEVTNNTWLIKGIDSISNNITLLKTINIRKFTAVFTSH